MYKIIKPELFRENVVFVIQSILYPPSNIENTTIEQEEPSKLSINIEKGIFNYAIKEATNQKIIKKWQNKYFVQLYKDRFRSVYINLKTNNHLVNQLKNEEIKPKVLAFMTHQEMCPDQWNELIQKKIKREESKYVNRTEASTDIYQCRKCKSRKCTYYSVQIRSADEPMTVFISCLSCGKNWKN